ncbi:MAG: hypothetical protein ACTS73_04040 [Arsenophonus sp. NEOnobi-MAG3]
MLLITPPLIFCWQLFSEYPLLQAIKQVKKELEELLGFYDFS